MLETLKLEKIEAVLFSSDGFESDSLISREIVGFKNFGINAAASWDHLAGTLSYQPVFLMSSLKAHAGIAFDWKDITQFNFNKPHFLIGVTVKF